MRDEFEAQRKAFLSEVRDYVDKPAERIKRAIEALGTKWVLHPANAPKKGNYNPLTGRRIK